jgi:hypothetical protein
MPGQKRATPPVERDPTNAPSKAAAATGPARRSERGRGASLAGRATASPDVPCAVSADDAVIRSPATARAQSSATPSPRLSFGDQRSRSLLSHHPQLAVARLAFGCRLAGGGGGDFILGVFAPVRAFADVLVHVRIPR